VAAVVKTVDLISKRTVLLGTKPEHYGSVTPQVVETLVAALDEELASRADDGDAVAAWFLGSEASTQWAMTA
jgi:hemoglobin-like flavoprotein